MTISSLAARQAVSLPNHAVARILVISTAVSAISLWFVAFVT